jgi:hypothetical protein
MRFLERLWVRLAPAQRIEIEVLIVLAVLALVLGLLVVPANPPIDTWRAPGGRLR